MARITPESQRMGALLKSYRQRLALTQDDLESASGVKRDYIASIESGKIQIVYPKDMNALARVLGFSPWELLDAAGYKTEGGCEDIDPALQHAAKKLDAEQQRAAAAVLRSMAKASGA